jgi:hypothetical protein
VNKHSDPFSSSLAQGQASGVVANNTQYLVGKPVHRGYRLAILACVLIAADTAMMLCTALWVFHLWLNGLPLKDLLTQTVLPVVIFLVWLTGIAATAAAIVSIFVYGYRERWFWRYLVIGSLAWMAFPPLHLLIGLASLALLLRNRKRFPSIQPAASPAS